MKQNNLFKDGAQLKDSFAKGFFAMYGSISTVLKNTELIRYFIIPFLLNIIILLGVGYFAYTYLYSWISGYMTGESFLFKMLGFMIRIILVAMILLISTLIYSAVGSIVIAPFNDLISLRVEEKLTGVNFNEKFSFAAFASDMIRILKNIIKLLLLIVALNIPLSFINLIPVAGTILFSIISFLITAFFCGFNFFDFPLDRRRMGFWEKLKVTMKFKFTVMGLGTGFFIFSFIPVINFLGLNLGAVAATSIFIDTIRPFLKNAGEK